LEHTKTERQKDYSIEQETSVKMKKIKFYTSVLFMLLLVRPMRWRWEFEKLKEEFDKKE
jgi:hypothetical protein